MKDKKSLFYVSISNLIRILLLPILVIYIFSNTLIIKYVLNDNLNSNEAILAQIAQSSNNNLDMISVVTANIANNSKIHTLLTEWDKAESSYKKSEISGNINGLISTNLNYLTYYDGVIFNLKNNTQYIYGNPKYSEDIEEKTKQINYIDNRVSLINDYIYDENIALIIPIKNRITMIKNLMVIVDKEIFKPKKIINSNTNLIDIFMTKDYKSKSGLEKIYIKNQKIVYEDSCKLEKFNLSVIAEYDLTPTIILMLKLNLLFLMGVILIILSLFIYYKRYRKMILDPIDNTVRNIDYIRKNGELDEIFQSNDIKEINNLNINLNSMIKEIKDLINDNKRINDEKLSLEITALQSQITPHFIFNTLNSIRIQAMINEDKEVANHIKSFSSLIKSNFTKGNIHTLDEEVNEIKSYFDIMKLRYGDKIKTNINMDNKVKDKKILKLIIQPIIENSIIHGLTSKNYEGQIWIDIYEKENKIIIEVKDNGIGMSTEKIAEILTGEGTGIGIYNADRRIKIYYGKEYGINIESEFNKYTKTIIVLPCI